MPQRLDQLLVTLGHFPSRERARNAIEQACVKINGNLITKPGKQVLISDRIECYDPLRFVSRGGLKLETAISGFGLNFEGKTVLDIGASTGGFTDCALQHEASFVFAVDVGTGQLHPSLQNHPKVKSIEKTDIRSLLPETINNQAVDYIVMDVSFISLKHIFPVIGPFVAHPGNMVALIKPQFEAGAQALNKQGIVKDPSLHVRVIHELTETAMHHGWFLHHLMVSPVHEGKNIEYLSGFNRQEAENKPSVETVVANAFEALKTKPK